MSTLTTLAPAVLAGDRWDGWGPGPGPWFLIFPLLWFLFVVLVVGLVARRWRRGPWGPGPWGPGPWAAGPWAAGSPRSGQPAGTGAARSVLAERFARGEIDEQEYRARLEVLLAQDDRPSG